MSELRGGVIMTLIASLSRTASINDSFSANQSERINFRSWRAPWKGGAFPVGESPTRRQLQPEATGATVEVTKRLKPSVKRATKYGGSASVQAVTQVNAG
jgi:hypothetical protein